MTYPTPFVFAIKPGLPLLVMSCSDVKVPTERWELRRFAELYDGPLWKQVKCSKYPLSNVAAISALYGFLEPGMAIETYNRKMDDDACRRICHTSDHVYRLAKAIREAGSAFIVGGKSYREVAETAIRVYPELARMVTFATGSYLQQRKQLGEWLRENMPRTFHPRTTARFWVSYGGGLTARIKLRKGETYSHAEGGQTDEGFSYIGRTWEFDGKEVTVSWVRNASDCDGPISSGGSSFCPLEDLTQGYVCPDHEPFARNGTMLYIRFPVWRKRGREWQRDYNAEAAGY